MANKMLIDATHPEETRVVVLRGNRVEEFDFESANRKQLRGNIYLAKVTRVEPSLQAAFVDYGGNRHGFLAFSRNPSRLLSDPGRRPAGADRRGGARATRRRGRGRRARRRGSAAARAAPRPRHADGSASEPDRRTTANGDASPAAEQARVRAAAPHERSQRGRTPSGARRSRRTARTQRSRAADRGSMTTPTSDRRDRGRSSRRAETSAPRPPTAPTKCEPAPRPQRATPSDADAGKRRARPRGDNIDRRSTAIGDDGEEVVESVGGDDALEEVPERRRARAASTRSRK